MLVWWCRWCIKGRQKFIIHVIRLFAAPERHHWTSRTGYKNILPKAARELPALGFELPYNGVRWLSLCIAEVILLLVHMQNKWKKYRIVNLLRETTKIRKVMPRQCRRLVKVWNNKKLKWKVSFPPISDWKFPRWIYLEFLSKVVGSVRHGVFIYLSDGYAWISIRIKWIKREWWWNSKFTTSCSTSTVPLLWSEWNSSLRESSFPH